MCMYGAVLATLPPAHLAAQDSTRRAQTLETVTVKDSAEFISVRLAGFERRRLLRQGSVTFITGEEITKRGTIRLSDAIRRAHGVRIVESDNGDNLKLVASSRWQLPSGGGVLVRAPPKRSAVAGTVNGGGSSAADLAPCIMQVAVDGHVKERGYSVDEISVSEVHGVEVYPGAASLPGEFGSMKADGWCGLVIIWTRAR